MSDSNLPLVSFIIPMYNASEYIEECLGSVLNQNYTNIEIIVIDDGSTDDGAERVRKFKDVKLLQQSNQGVSVARKAGVKAAKGVWIMFVDADDMVKKDIICDWSSKMVDGTDIIVGKMHSDRMVSGEQMIYDLLEKKNFPKEPWLKVFRRTLFENDCIFDIPRNIVWGEDVLMLLRLAMEANGNVFYSKARNYSYRRHPEQITKKFRVTSGYEEDYHTLLMDSFSERKLNLRTVKGTIRFRLHIFERILRDCKYTDDDIRGSEWFKKLIKDIHDNDYRPSLWFKLLLKHGNGTNIRRLRSVKWIFKSLNAF